MIIKAELVGWPITLIAECNPLISRNVRLNKIIIASEDIMNLVDKDLISLWTNNLEAELENFFAGKGEGGRLSDFRVYR